MDALNTKVLNLEALGGEPEDSPPLLLWDTVNGIEINAIPVNGYETYTTGTIVILPAFNAISIEQIVGMVVASGNVISIVQDVQFLLHYEGVVVEIEQSVKSVFAGNVISVEQRVLDKTENTFFNRNGWVVDLTINGFSIPHDRIFKDISITKEENQSNQCTFALLVADPVEFIDQVWGKSVTVDYVTPGGSQRMFTGVVAIPEIDIINRFVTFTCSNNRDEIINNTMQNVVKTTGRYSETVQGEYNTPSEEMNLRMNTVTASLDFNGSNVYSLNSWFAKPTPDFTFYDEDVYYRVPKVEWQDRTKIKNHFTINLSYQYTRLYNYQREFGWDLPFDFCTFLISQYSLPNLSMIESAIQNAKWVPVAPVTYTSVFAPGYCADGALLLFWNAASYGSRGNYVAKFDSNGNVIGDPSGNTVYDFKPFNDQTDISKIYTIGAHWVGSTRFSQYIEEDYTIVVKSTQSEAQFGSVKDASSNTLKDDFDDSSWEDYTVYTPPPAEAIMLGGGSYYFNKDTDPNATKQAILAEIDIAKASILSTHRNTQVIVETPIKPYLELSHTIALSTNKLNAKGKTQRLQHTLSVSEGKGSTTTLTLALFRSKGSANTSPTVAPTRPSDSISLPNTPVTLGSHYGITSPSFNGHIGNKNNPAVAGTPYRTNVQEEFRVDTPAIPDAYRKLRTLPVAASYEVAIPNDPLDITL